MSTIGIKINDNCFSANTAKTIRDIINISISELKEKICNNEFIYLSEDIDDEGLQVISEIYTKLINDGTVCSIYDDEDEISIDILNNLISMNNEINMRIIDEMENEAIAEEND